MGRLSEKDKAELFNTYLNAVTSAIKDIAGSTKEALNLIAEEGIWLAYGFNIFIVLGEVNIKDNPIAYVQRQVIATNMGGELGDSIKFNTDIFPHVPKGEGKEVELLTPIGFFKSYFQIPVIDGKGSPLKLLNAFDVLQGWIKPIGIAIQGKKDDDTYLAVPMEYRIILSLMLPGITRSMVDILAQRSTLTLG